MSPTSEYRILNAGDINLNPNNAPFLTNFALTNKRGAKRKVMKSKQASSKKLSKLTHNATESMDALTATEYQPTRDNFSSIRQSNRGQMSAYRIKTEEDYELQNSHILRTVQHGDAMQSLDLSQMSTSYPLQIRKMMSKLQSRLEDELSDRTRELEKNFEKKWKAIRDDSEFSTHTLSKNEIKRLILDEKENILLEIKETQRTIARKEVHEKIESELQDFEKKISNKMETAYQENFEAIKYLSDKVKQCLDHCQGNRSQEKEIHSLKTKMHEISKKFSHKQTRSYIGHELSESDMVWEKVDSKLDKIYEYQRKISEKNIAAEDKKQIYNKFGEAIVGLVKNLVDGKGAEKENVEATEFNLMINSMNESIDKLRQNSSFANEQPNNFPPEKFNLMMDKMTELVKKWNKYDDKILTRCGTSKERVIIDSNFDNTEERQNIDELSNFWNNRFNELTEEIKMLKTAQAKDSNRVNSCFNELHAELTSWRENDAKNIETSQEGVKQKLEYFAKNINEIYSLLEIMKKKIKSKTQSKNNEVIFARLNGYSKNIKTLNELYKKIKEINSFCKKTIVDVSDNFMVFSNNLELIDKQESQCVCGWVHGAA